MPSMPWQYDDEPCSCGSDSFTRVRDDVEEKGHYETAQDGTDEWVEGLSWSIWKCNECGKEVAMPD